MSTSDAERSGHPVEVAIQKIIDTIHDMVMDNRKLKVNEIASDPNPKTVPSAGNIIATVF